MTMTKGKVDLGWRWRTEIIKHGFRLFKKKTISKARVIAMLFFILQNWFITALLCFVTSYRYLYINGISEKLRHVGNRSNARTILKTKHTLWDIDENWTG
jgi:hypothetical protein